MQESLAAWAASMVARVERDLARRSDFFAPKKIVAAKVRARDTRTKMYGRNLGPIAAMEERPGCIGLLADLVLQSDDLMSLIMPSLTLRAKRGLACCCFQLRTLLTPVLRAPTLDVGPHDATWENAVFVARLPGLQTLRIDGEHFVPEVDVGRLRGAKHCILMSEMGATGTDQMGATAALFVGALTADYDCGLRLPRCSWYYGGSYRLIRFKTLRAGQEIDWPMWGYDGSRSFADSTADACAFLGPLSRNQALLNWPFNGRFGIDQCRAILRGDKSVENPSVNGLPASWQPCFDAEFQMWAEAAKDALPLLWVEYDEMRRAEYDGWNKKGMSKRMRRRCVITHSPKSGGELGV